MRILKLTVVTEANLTKNRTGRDGTGRDWTGWDETKRKLPPRPVLLMATGKHYQCISLLFWRQGQIPVRCQPNAQPFPSLSEYSRFF